MPWKTDDYIDLLTPFQSGYSMGQMNRSRKLQEEQARIREAQVAQQRGVEPVRGADGRIDWAQTEQLARVQRDRDAVAGSLAARRAMGAAGVAWDADRTTVRWNRLDREAGTGTSYDLTRGSLVELRATSAFPAGVCLGAALAAAEAVDAEPPPPADGFWYLVRARNTCGIGSWGAGSAGGARNPAGCP